MKAWQGFFCGSILTITALAQTAPAPTPAQAAGTPSSPAGAPKLSTLGAPEVKGPEHPLTLDQMKQIYDAMGYGKTFEQNREQGLAMQKMRAPFIPQDVWDDFDATSKKVDYPAAFLPVYAKYISTEDAAKVIEFAKTDAGKNFLASIPETSRDLNGVIQKQQQQVSQEVQGRHKDEIDAALKKYREEHAPKPAPTLGKPGDPKAPGAPAGAAGTAAPSSPAPAAGAPPAAPAPAAPASTPPPPAQK